MELVQEKGQGNHITSYEPGKLTINSKTYEINLIVSPSTIIEDWAPTSFQALTPDNLAVLLTLNPQVVIIGTGEKQHFLSKDLTKIFNDKKIGVETMDTKAACRTYNLLMAEGRRVVAGFLLK